MTEVIGVDERIVTTGAVQAPVRNADDFARRFSVGSDPFNGSIGFEFSYRPQVVVSAQALEAPVGAFEPRVEPVHTTSPFSRLRERGTRYGQRIESGIHNTLTSITESTRSAISRGQAELTAARARIIEAMTPRSRKVERAQQAATIILEEPILSVPPVYDGGAADKRAYLSTWITPTQVRPEAQAEIPEGEAVTHYHYNETGKVVVAEIAAAVNADAVRTQAEFSVASEALKNAYAEAKKGIEARVAGSTSDSEKARAAAQIELVRRLTSTARLRAYNSMRSAERERRLAQPIAPISQDVLDNRARAEIILQEVYAELGIDGLTYSPDATKDDALWQDVSDRIRARYDMATVLTLTAIESDENKDLATINFYRDLIESKARKACATARLMAWNQMTRPEPVIPAEVVELVEAVEAEIEAGDEMIAEPAVVTTGTDLDDDESGLNIESDEPVIVETGSAKRMRLTRANRLYLGAAALLLAGVAGTGVLIYGNASRNFEQISAAQAAEAALADRQAGQQNSNTNGVYAAAIQSQTPAGEASSTPPREGFRSLHSFGFTKPMMHRVQAAPVQTFEAVNADKQHDAQATEDAKPERASRIDYTNGKPVKISVTCGDKVIQFVRKDRHNNPQDVQFDYFASSDDIPDGYEIPVDKAQRVMHGGIPITVYHSESDGEQEAAGYFQDYVLRNGGPNILPGCTYTAEQVGDDGEPIIEVSEIVDAFLMPARVKDPSLGERNVDPDDVLSEVNRSLGQRYPEGKKPRIDGADLTCYSFAHGDQVIGGVHYDDRETTRNLVWVLSSQ